MPDLAFLMVPVTDPAIANLPLCRYPLAFATSPAPRLPGLKPPRPFGSTSFATILRMTRDGIRLIVIPPAVALRELADGTLRPVRTDIAPPDLVFTASWPVWPEDRLAQRLASLARQAAAEAGQA